MQRTVVALALLVILTTSAAGLSIVTAEEALHNRCKESGNETVSAEGFNVTRNGHPVQRVECDALDTYTFPDPEFESYPQKPGPTSPPLPVIGAVATLLGIGLIVWRGR